MRHYRFGIVGLSWITSEPAPPGAHPVLGPAAPHSHLSALATIPSATVAAACDIDPSARDLFRQRWHSTWQKAAIYDDYTAMLRETPLDVVCVATPDDLHARVVRAAAEAGVKAIFCEKPMSTHTDEIDDMIAAASEHCIVVSVNHTRRWFPSYVSSREAIRNGAIGDLIHIAINFGGPRAMLWRNHSHFFDLLCYFAESDPAWVVGELEPGFEGYGTRYHGDGGRDSSLEPGANAYIAFENGVRAVLGGQKQATQILSVDLIGSSGRIWADDRQARLFQLRDEGTVSRDLHPTGSMQGMQAAIVDLLTALETGRPPQCPPHEARKAVAIIEGILASQAAGNCRVEIGRPPVT